MYIVLEKKFLFSPRFSMVSLIELTEKNPRQLRKGNKKAFE
jgi:hypothetical protein